MLSDPSISALKVQRKSLNTLRRRLEFLNLREHKNSYDTAEIKAIQWVLQQHPRNRKSLSNSQSLESTYE